MPGEGTDEPFTDPVCGMKVAANPEREVLYAGQRYYFCSNRCLDKSAASAMSLSSVFVITNALRLRGTGN
jgi:YHS domain-containing protein